MTDTLTVNELTEAGVPLDARTWGPFKDYELVVTDYGIYGLPTGEILWFIEGEEWDREEQRMRIVHLPQRARVVPMAVLDTTKIVQTRPMPKPYLGNWQTGIPTVPDEQRDAVLELLTQAIGTAVAQALGSELSVKQAAASAADLVENTGIAPEDLLEVARSMTADEEEAPDGEEVDEGS